MTVTNQGGTMDAEQKSKPGRKPRKKTGTMTPAQRQAERRIAQAERINTGDESLWTDADCLAILSGSRWRRGPMDLAAWRRLGQLRGFA